VCCQTPSQCQLSSMFHPQQRCVFIVLVQDLLQHGEKGRLQGVLQQQMQQILPPDAYQLCTSNVTHSQAHYHITQPQDQAGDQARGAGTSSSSVRRPPCVLGATRVRPCCPACLEPDVFIGEQCIYYALAAPAEMTLQ
jgi:hypothetical protein